eukprot:Em0001g1856a
MAAVAVGQISEFQSELESITVYLERVGQYFIANEIPTGRRVAVLLSVIGSRTYSLLRSLLHPKVPGEKTSDQLATALREHFEPKRLVVVERFHFNRRNQEALRDHFVCGLTNESIQRRLLSEANLDFEKAVQIARGMETAQKNSQVVQASEGRVQKFQDHKGHIEAKCKTRQDKEETKWMEEQGEDECKGHRYHVIDTLCEETMGSVFKSQDTSGTSVYRVKMEINGEMLMMEIDTGAAVSLISEDTYRKKFSKLQLTASAVRLATYTTQRIEVCGEVRVRVRLGDQEKHCRLVVVAGKGPNAEGLHPLESKIEAMVKVPPPKNVAELKSFLGMVNYYAKFLPNLSTTISPLYTLLKKNSRWQWTEECSQAFLAAKGMLTSSKVLAHYNPKLSLILATDASSYGVGAVLTQVSEEGTERPIAYVSRTLSDAERNYAQIEKEALAIIFGVKRFHVYLYGRKFLLLTDHKPLTTIFGPKTGLPVVAASRLQRWALVLSAYQYDVKFRATEEHGNVDGLSRLPLKGERHEEEETEASIFNMVQIETLPVTAGQLRNESRQDKELSKVMRYLQNGWPEMVTAELQPYEAKKTELTIENHTLLWGMRVVIPQVYEMTSTTAQKTVDILRHIFAAYGLPEQLVSDNGPQFVAKEFEDFMLKNGIRHIRSAPYHPATNGLVERFVQSFKRAMETGKNSGQTLQHRLSSFLLAYRSSPHSVTNVSPCSLFLQRELRTKLDLLRQTTEQIVRKKQEEQKEGHDKNTRERVFEQNDIVWASNFGVGERWVKGKIKQSSGPSSYLVELADGREWRRHIDHLRRAEGGVRKTEGIKSEIDDQQMMQPDKEMINKEKRAVEPAPEEAGEVQIDQDETPTEVEENEDKTMERKPEVPVARHRYQLRQNRRPPDRY